MQASTRRHIAAAVLLAAGLIAVHAIRQMRDVDPGYMPRFDTMPDQIGQYVARELPVEESVLHFLRPDAIRAVEYRAENGNPPWLDLSVIYGKDWRPIHSPLHCLAAEGWAIGVQENVNIHVPAGPEHHRDVTAKQLRATKGGMELVVLYALADAGGTSSSWPRFAFKVATGPAGSGGVILLIRAPVVQGDGDRAREAVAEALAAIFPSCVEFWYEVPSSQ